MTNEMMTVRALLEKSPDADLLREMIGLREPLKRDLGELNSPDVAMDAIVTPFRIQLKLKSGYSAVNQRRERCLSGKDGIKVAPLVRSLFGGRSEENGT